MDKAVNYRGVFGGFIINFRDLEETYFIDVHDILLYIKSTDRKSIPVDWCRDYGVRIEQTKKRTRYTYNLSKWLEGYYR